MVIPVKNGDVWLEKLLDGITKQSLYGQTEVIIIDSGSTDRSLEIIGKYPFRVLEIKSEEFNHGLTRNLGAREAKGKYVVMTVQDAVPANEYWLQHLISGFINERVAGVCGQQIVPHEKDKNPALWFRPMSEPQRRFVKFDSSQEFMRLSPGDRRSRAGWDNVTSAYRKDLLLQHPFQKIDFAEDLCWAKDMLLLGYTLAYIDEARVYHYHHHLPSFIPPRYFSVFYFEYKLFGMRPGGGTPIWKCYLITIKILLMESRLSLGEKIKWIFFNTQYWLALNKTIKQFNKALNISEAALDVRYQEICKRKPQAPKY